MILEMAMQAATRVIMAKPEYGTYTIARQLGIFRLTAMCVCACQLCTEVQRLSRWHSGMLAVIKGGNWQSCTEMFV